MLYLLGKFLKLHECMYTVLAAQGFPGRGGGEVFVKLNKAWHMSGNVMDSAGIVLRVLDYYIAEYPTTICCQYVLLGKYTCVPIVDA